MLVCCFLCHYHQHIVKETKVLIYNKGKASISRER